MAASKNRDYLFLQPLGTSRMLRLAASGSFDPTRRGYKLVAEIDATGHFHQRDHGWLIQLPNKRFAVLQVGGSVRNVDQRKAAAALYHMRSEQDADDDAGMDIEGGEAISDQPAERDPAVAADELAAAVKAWRGDLPLSRAAQLLGIPKRTLEGIEQGRGFRYPRLVYLALAAFGTLADGPKG